MRAAAFLRDIVARRQLAMEHLPGKLMIADIMTKAPSRSVFVTLLSLLDRFARDNTAHAS